MSSRNLGDMKRTSLFPSAATSSSQESSYRNHDWLENKSFTSETAEKLVEFQRELGKLQKESDDSDDDQNNIDDRDKSRDHRSLTANSSIKQPMFDLMQTISDIHVEAHKSTRRKEHEADSKGLSHQKKKKRKYFSSSEDEAVREGKKKHKHKHKKKHKKEKYISKKKKDTDIPGLFESKKVFLDDIEDIAPEHAFKLDRIPDNNSLTYGSLYNGHIANYRPACNQCIGSEGIQPLFIKDRDTDKRGKASGERYHSKEYRRLVKQPADEIIKIFQVEMNSQLCKENYIPVNQVSEVDSFDKDVRQTILDDSTSLYVMGKGKETEFLEMEKVRPDPMRQKIADYNKRLRESPSNVKLWLEFVRFQDKLMYEESEYVSVKDVESGGKKPSARAAVEKKLSILDKALESNPADIDLLLAKIELKSEISDTFKMNKELEDLLFIHTANTKLWKFYLTFNQSRISAFTVTKMTKYYHKCFRTLLRILEGDVQTHCVPENLESEILDIFVQYCFFLKQTGYKEKAIASFQALLEYNFFAPPSEVSKKNKMAEFEVFWDSNCPRIGTPDALGWKNCIEKKFEVPGRNIANSLEEIEDAIMEKKLRKHDTWLEIESLRDQHTWLPWQPGEGQTEDDCEDVEKVVVFDDVSPILFNVSEKFRIELVTSFLKFLSLPAKVDVSAKLMPLCCENVNNLTAYQGSIKEDVVVCDDNEILRNLAFEVLRLVIPSFSGKVRSDLTICQIRIQLSKYKSESLSKGDKKEMKKMLKSTLKEENNRNDLFVWSEYIDLERSIGKPGEGDSVIETALTMYSGESIEVMNESIVGLISLYCQYCEMLLNMDQKIPCNLLPKASPVSSDIKKKVLSVVNCLVDCKKFMVKELSYISGAVILKTMSSLSKLSTSLFESMGHEGTSDVLKEKFLKLVWCQCLFAYSKSGLKSSLEIYSSMIVLASNSNKNIPDLEKRLHSDQLRLIVYNLSTSSSPLQILRECLDAALRKFPDDPVFLSLFTDVERKSRISGRFNSFFDRWCRKVEAPTPTVIAVLTQMDFISNLKNSDTFSTSECPSGLVHRARSWLEQSLQHNSLQHCPLLWRLYLLLEKQVGDAGRLKGLFYRAIQQCPWNKEIYIDGVRIFGAEQLQEIVDLMTEKELRVQIPVEELEILIT